MRTPEEIREHNTAKTKAIFDKFEPLTKDDDLKKSEVDAKDDYYTAEALGKFKEELFKSIDAGTISEEELTKAQDDLLNLKRETREIDGEEIDVFVKAE